MRSKKVIALLLTTAALMGTTITGCGNKINEDATFATLNDTKISMGVANIFAKYEQAMYDSYYMPSMGEGMWESDMTGQGTTLAEDVKSQVAENLQNIYLLKEHMDEYGVSITAEEEEAIAKAADDFIAANSKEAIKQFGAEDKENVIEFLRLNTIKQKMYNRIIQDANAEVSDEEAAQRTFSYVEINTDGYTDEAGTYVEYTEEEKAAFKEAAATIATAADFDAAVTDAGYSVSTQSYGSAADEDAYMDVAVLEAADAMKAGQISDVIETDTAVYVIRLDSEFDEEATATKKEEMRTELENEYYTGIVEGWISESTWTLNEEEWAKVNFEDHFAAPAVEDTEGDLIEEIEVDTQATETTEAVETTEAQ